MQAKQIAEWREGYARQVLNIDFKPLPDTRFGVGFTPLAEGVRAVKSRFSPGATFRDETLVKDGDESLSVVIALSHAVDLDQGQHRLRLRSAEAAVIPHWRPGSVGSENGFSALSITIPRAELLPRVPDLDKTYMRRMSSNSAALQLLRGYCETLQRDGIALSPEMQQLAQRHVYDLAALAIAEAPLDGEREGSAVTTARLAAANAFIAAHFRDPDLNLTSVAKAQDISPRYLQKLFHAAEISFIEHVNGLRLEFARKLLAQTGEHTRRISDVALLAGFSDVSHFHRLFRARFGDTPGSVSKK
jgi:AraC-like DNA-binding protein